MATENGKQPAFPVESLGTAFGSVGLSKLEWFAGMAMVGLLSQRTIGNQMSYDQCALCAFRQAYAMVQESEVQNV